VWIDDSVFLRNTANEALFQVSALATLKVSSSIFSDNYSLGRGSIVFAQQLSSVTLFASSVFSRNYAILGGVFFA